MNPTRHTLHVGPVEDADDIADASVALVVTSPPYPMISMWDSCFGSQDPAIRKALRRGEAELAFELMHRRLDPVWKAMYRVLLPGGILCINIGDATRSFGGEFRLFSNHSRILRSCLALGFRNLPNILWRKPTNAPTKFMGSGMLPAGAYVTLEHEHLLILRKGNRREFHGAVNKASRRQSAYFWEERNTWFSDLWEIRGTDQGLPGRGSRARSAAFPFEIPFRLVLMFSCAGDLVVDPFLGTGTTVLAAAASGRHSCGYEVDRRVAALAQARMANSAEFLNNRLRLRLEEHQTFVRSRKPGTLRYRNARIEMPVMTRQERELFVPLVTKIESLEVRRYLVHYSPVPPP
jgi:modification methylase